MKQASGAAPHARADHPWQALGWMILSALGFSLMSLGVKHLSPVIPSMQIVFFRSAINFLLVAALMAYRGQTFFPSHRRLLIFRGLMGFGGVTCLFYGIQHLPLSIASMINWSSPLFVVLFSWLLLGEKMKASSLFWVFVAFLGMLVLVSPQGSSSAGEVASAGAQNPWAVGIALLGAAFGGMAYVAVRAATARVGVHVIILYFTGIASLLSLPFAGATWVQPSPQQAWVLLAVGFFASVGQFCMTQGYRYAAAGLVSTMGLLNALFALLWGSWFFGEKLQGVQVWGMLLLALGVALATQTSYRVRHRQAGGSS